MSIACPICGVTSSDPMLFYVIGTMKGFTAGSDSAAVGAALPDTLTRVQSKMDEIRAQAEAGGMEFSEPQTDLQAMLHEMLLEQFDEDVRPRIAAVLERQQAAARMLPIHELMSIATGLCEEHTERFKACYAALIQLGSQAIAAETDGRLGTQ